LADVDEDDDDQRLMIEHVEIEDSGPRYLSVQGNKEHYDKVKGGYFSTKAN
jgi:hypothetical protein